MPCAFLRQAMPPKRGPSKDLGSGTAPARGVHSWADKAVQTPRADGAVKIFTNAIEDVKTSRQPVVALSKSGPTHHDTTVTLVRNVARAISGESPTKLLVAALPQTALPSTDWVQGQRTKMRSHDEWLHRVGRLYTDVESESTRRALLSLVADLGMPHTALHAFGFRQVGPGCKHGFRPQGVGQVRLAEVRKGHLSTPKKGGAPGYSEEKVAAIEESWRSDQYTRASASNLACRVLHGVSLRVAVREIAALHGVSHRKAKKLMPPDVKHGRQVGDLCIVCDDGCASAHEQRDLLAVLARRCKCKVQDIPRSKLSAREIVKVDTYVDIAAEYKEHMDRKDNQNTCFKYMCLASQHADRTTPNPRIGPKLPSWPRRLLVVVFDFRTSFTCGQGPRAGARSGAYFRRTSAGVFGFAVWMPGVGRIDVPFGPDYVDLVSDDPDHTAWAAASAARKAFSWIAAKWPDLWKRVEEVAAWVDKGAHFTGFVFAGQILYHLGRMFRFVSLNWFEVYHGKTVLDASFGEDTRVFNEAIENEDVMDGDDCVGVRHPAESVFGRASEVAS